MKLDYCPKDEQSDNFFNFLTTKMLSESETLINYYKLYHYENNNFFYYGGTTINIGAEFEIQPKQ